MSFHFSSLSDARGEYTMVSMHTIPRSPRPNEHTASAPEEVILNTPSEETPGNTDEQYTAASQSVSEENNIHPKTGGSVLTRSNHGVSSADLTSASSQEEMPVPHPGDHDSTSKAYLIEQNDGTTATFSKWGIGWQTPTKMITFYILALLCAILHLIMILYLKGKPADGPHKVTNQSYVSAAANILASAFALSLGSSMIIVFTQCFWHLLRTNRFKVSVIEKLYSLHSNPFDLLDPVIVKSASTLFVLALLMATTKIGVSFTPGALTVAASTNVSAQVISVPTFNASYMGNGSWYDARINCLDNLSGFSEELPFFYVLPMSMLGLYSSPLKNLAIRTLTAGGYSTPNSPCGANCSYSINIDAPYMECNASSPMVKYNLTSTSPPVYEGTWSSPLEVGSGVSSTSIPLLSNYSGIFNTSVLSLYAIDYGDDAEKSTMLAINNNLLCSPSRANYNLNITYENNIQSIDASLISVQKMTNLLISDAPRFLGAKNISGFFDPDDGAAVLNWTSEDVEWYRDLSIMAITDAMAIALSGSYTAYPSNQSTANTTLSGYSKDILWSTNLTWVDFVTNPSVPNINQDVKSVFGFESTGLGANNTIIGNTRFSNKYDQYTPPLNLNEYSIDFHITQDRLNEALLNITISTIPSYARWSTKANVTTSTNVNVYRFSKPTNFFVPYGLNLLFGLLFVVLGGFVLSVNGVAAMDGSFMQIIMTTTGSQRLHDAAVGGCLGGYQNIPTELSELKVRFGELKAMKVDIGDGKVVRRAGFGTTDEISPLEKGALYGRC